jgi:hypothetical protein
VNLIEKLERKGVTLEPKLTFKTTAPLDAETLTLLQAHKFELLKDLTAPGCMARLPWQLESLLRAASSGVLPTGTVNLPEGLVTDLSTYTLAWGCAYLTGDRDEALRRLWAVYRTWQGAN